MIILDTNVVSELMRPEPAREVASWVRDRDRRELRTTAITVAEIRYGIARLPDGRRKQVLLDAADDAFSTFEEQVLPVDTAAAEHYAAIASSRERAGKPIAGFDALIAAVCTVRALRSRPVTYPTSTAPALTSSIPGASHQAEEATGGTSPMSRCMLLGRARTIRR